MTPKFRIYDKLQRRYCEEDAPLMLCMDGCIFDRANEDWYEVGERYVVEFSTLLSDLNKTEIFEGDKFNDDYNNDGGYYVVEYDMQLSKFSVNLYSYEMYHNEGGGEEFDRELSCVDRNIIDVYDLGESVIIGTIHDGKYKGL